MDGTFGPTSAGCVSRPAPTSPPPSSPAGWTGTARQRLWAVAVLAVAAGVGVLLARRLGGRYAVALALAWGLVWIAVGRVTDQPRSAATAAAAVVAAVVVVTAAAQVRLRAVDRAEAA